MTTADLDRLLREITELRAELERLQSFRPTPPELDAFPGKVREYLLQLRKMSDATGDEAAAACARDTLAALAKLNEELRRLLTDCFQLGPKGPPDATN